MKQDSYVEKINQLLGIEDSYQAPERLMEIVLGDERDDAYRSFLEAFDFDVEHDWFHQYFEDENAQRTKLKQDFTPDCLSRLVSALVGFDPYSIQYEPSAGTGGMAISRWDETRKKFSTFEYHPLIQWFVCEDKSDRAIPFLLFNLSIRGINANVLLIDSLTRRCKSAYLVINEKNDMFAFSDVVELPKSDECKSMFGISEWIEKW